MNYSINSENIVHTVYVRLPVIQLFERTIIQTLIKPLLILKNNNTTKLCVITA